MWFQVRAVRVEGASRERQSFFLSPPQRDLISEVSLLHQRTLFENAPSRLQRAGLGQRSLGRHIPAGSLCSEPALTGLALHGQVGLWWTLRRHTPEQISHPNLLA